MTLRDTASIGGIQTSAGELSPIGVQGCASCRQLSDGRPAGSGQQDLAGLHWNVATKMGLKQLLVGKCQQAPGLQAVHWTACSKWGRDMQCCTT